MKICSPQIAHSLTSLKISHGFVASITSFPTQSIRALTSLRELDFSNNRLKTISDTSFHFLQDLRTIELNDNGIEQISKGTFQVNCVPSFAYISKSFILKFTKFSGRNSFKIGNDCFEF